jgi:hypothetical protein
MAGVAALSSRTPPRLLAAGELIVDKVPSVPIRVDPALVLGRVAAGALVGAVVGGRTGSNRGELAVIGGLIAFASAHATYRMRLGSEQRRAWSHRSCQSATRVSHHDRRVYGRTGRRRRSRRAVRWPM